MLEEKINLDYIQAMKNKDSNRSSTLNFLRASLKNIIIEKKVDKLEDNDVITVIKKQVKQRQDSIEQYTKGGRQDLADKESAELEILKSYLPAEMSEDQLKKIIEESKAELQAGSMKDMGKVMQHVLAKVAGQADGKMVSSLVKEALS